MNLEIGSEADREELAVVRAHEWRGTLSTEEFAERNRRLYQHEFGKNLTTYLLREKKGEILTSMDIVNVPLLLKDQNGHVREENGFLVASVVTPKQNRGKGFAAKMLQEYFSSNSKQSGVLYSDIGPAYYESFGFKAFPTMGVGYSPISKKQQGQPISGLAFSNGLKAWRLEQLKRTPGPAAALSPALEFLDWVIERFRFFAEIRKKSLPDSLFWRLSHGEEAHFLAAVPAFTIKQATIIWKTPDCPECTQFARALPTYWKIPGLDHVYGWEKPVKTAPHKRECPMLKMPGIPEASFVDPQFLDWW
jgi:hypothetical protein